MKPIIDISRYKFRKEIKMAEDSKISTLTGSLTETAYNSDKLDGLDSTDFALASHNHDTNYLGITAKAADSDKLDGLDSTDFALASEISAWQSYTPTTVIGWAEGYTIDYRYAVIGDLCFIDLSISGTSNYAQARVSTPVPVGGIDYSYTPVPRFMDNGVGYYAGGKVFGQIRPHTKSEPDMIFFWIDGSASGWTATNDKAIYFNAFYPIY